MELTLNMLGVLARSSPRALDFLLSARSVEWWAEFRKWRMDVEAGEGTSQSYLPILSSIAWASLGFVNKPEIERERFQVRSKPLDGDSLTVAGGVIEGAFFRDWIAEAGPEEYLRGRCAAGAYLDRYRKWIAVGTGKDWQDWFNAEVRRIEEASRSR